MKKILVPCDFSKPATEAFRFAISMANTTGARIDVLYAIDLPIMTDPVFGLQPIVMEPDFYTSFDDDAQSRFDHLKKEHGGGLDRITFKTQMGAVLTVLLQEIDRLQPDCIVMGTHGASGLKEFFVGSNTEKMVRFAPCPVYAIPAFSEFGKIKNIVHPTEMKLNQTDFIAHLKALQHLTNAKLHLLYVDAPGGSVTGPELKQYAENYNLSNFTLAVRHSADATEEIIRFTNEKKADLVAMATHSRRGIAHLVSGSVSEHVVNHIQTAVWTYSLKPLLDRKPSK